MRGRAPVLWYSALLVIILGGAGLTAFSRQERQHALGSPTSKTAPRANQDHWHTAYGVYSCDKWLDPVTDQKDDVGIHTHGDGIIHVHPFVSKAAGKNATLARFVTQVKATVETDRVTWPAGGGTVKIKKGDKCGDVVGQLKFFYNGKQVTGDPKTIRLTDRGKLVIAFVAPDKTAEAIGDPPSTPNLDSLTDVTPAPTSTVPGAAPADPTATTLTSATTAPGQPGATTTPPPTGQPVTTAPPTPTPTPAPATTPSSAP